MSKQEERENWLLVDESRGNHTIAESKSEAQDRKEDMEQLGAEMSLYQPGEHPAESAPEHPDPIETDVVDTDDGEIEPVPETPPLDEDPVDWMPEHFVDEIEGVPTVNRKGYCVIAARYGVGVESTAISLPSDSDFEFAEFKAIATTEDGETYSGFGSAHVDRGDDKTLLGELAETRAMKRAVAWATGVGLTAMEEMQG